MHNRTQTLIYWCYILGHRIVEKGWTLLRRGSHGSLRYGGCDGLSGQTGRTMLAATHPVPHQVSAWL